MTPSPTPDLAFTEYFEVLYDTKEIQKLLREQVRLFALLYLKRDSRMAKQKVWNTNTTNMKLLDITIQKLVQSDVHDNALTVNLGV